MRFTFVTLAALALSACSTPQTADAPTIVATKRGDYRAVADCAYLRLSQQYQSLSQVKLDSLRLVRLSYDADGVNFWSVSFSDAGGQTRVEYRARPSVQGPTWNAQQLADQIAGC